MGSRAMGVPPVVVVCLAVVGIVAGFQSRTVPRDHTQTLNVEISQPQGFQERVRRETGDSQSRLLATHRRRLLRRRQGRRGNVRRKEEGQERPQQEERVVIKNGRRAVIRRKTKVRTGTRSPVFLNERELSPPIQAIRFQTSTPGPDPLPSIRVHQHSTVGILSTMSPAPQISSVSVTPPAPSAAPSPPPSPSPPAPTLPTSAPAPPNFPSLPPLTPSERPVIPLPAQFQDFPNPLVRFRPVDTNQEDITRKNIQPENIFKVNASRGREETPRAFITGRRKVLKL